MFKKVVVPLDGSALAERVFPHLLGMVSTAQTEITLIHVVELWRYPPMVDGVGSIGVIEALHESGKAYLAQQEAYVRSQGFQVRTHRITGDATWEILKLAEAIGADLIAMTTHGRSGVARWLLGSVAERIFQRTHIPVLLVRAMTEEKIEEPEHALAHILVPLDGSALAEQALPVAESLALAAGAEILLMQAIPPLDRKNKEILFGTEQAADAAFDKWYLEANQYLHHIQQQVEAKGIRCDLMIRVAEPAESICATSKAEQTDLIVISTHGRTGMDRWLHGSVASKVLRSASCPTLLVHSRQAEKTDAKAEDVLAVPVGT